MDPRTTEPSFELMLDAVTAGYDGAPVVQDLTLTIRQGQRVGLIGRNGAGKTTTLGCAMGLTELQKGNLRLDGQLIDQWPTHERARAGLGYVPQSRDIFPSLSVEENLLSALQGRVARAALDEVYALFPRLRERRNNGGNQLSGGEQQMLSVARALVGKPRILLLDEPLEGLAPKVRDELMEAIDHLVTRTGVGCLLVEQHVDVVLDFADHVVVLERGQPVFNGSTQALRADSALLNRTIGLEKV